MSLVEVAPSTLSVLNVRSEASRRIRVISSAETSASVVRKASIVAMLGAIIPQPLAIPPRVKVEPLTSASLALWSVVRIPRAASWAPPADSFLASLGVAARMTSIGSGVPMIPVEQTSTSSGRDVQRPSRLGRHRLGVGEAGGAGAGIGVAAVDDDRRRPAAIVGEPPAREHDRRRDELVLGEHRRGRDRLAVLGGDHRHVEAAALDPGMAAGGDEALSGGDAHG